MMNACTRWSFLAVPVLAAIGCSDPAPLPNQAALNLSIDNVTPGEVGKSCPVVSGYQVGAQKTVAGQSVVSAPTKLDPGQSVVDGQGNASVTCSVKKQGDGTYAFSGSLHASSATNDLVTINVSNGTIAADQVTGSGEVSVYTPQLAGSFDSGSTPCVFTVINKQVKGGSIWASFSCPTIDNPQTPANECAIDNSSVLVFENCAGS